MTEEQLDEYEAWLLNPERWQKMTPPERKREAGWLLYYTHEARGRLQQRLNDPTVSAEGREKCKRGLDRLKRREEKLLEYADDAAYEKILNPEEKATK